MARRKMVTVGYCLLQKHNSQSVGHIFTLVLNDQQIRGLSSQCNTLMRQFRFTHDRDKVRFDDFGSRMCSFSSKKEIFLAPTRVLANRKHFAAVSIVTRGRYLQTGHTFVRLQSLPSKFPTIFGHTSRRTEEIPLNFH